MKTCKVCLQPDSRPGLYFSDDGICGACIWEIEKKEIDWEKRYSELLNLAENIRKNNSDSNYDCVIGVSGGKDSTRQAMIARDDLGLRCLLVNCEPPNITEIGKKNIENIKNLGFDVFSIRTNPQIIKKLMKYDFYKHLNPVKITEFCLFASTYIIAEKFNIPLIIQGENPGLILGTRLTGVGTDSNALNADQMQTLSLGWQEYLNEAISEKDLFLYHYNRKKLEENGTKAIWLNYFIHDWDPRTNTEFSKKHGLTLRPENFDPNNIGSYHVFTALDSDLNPVNQMLKFIKFGFGQCMDQVCYDIRSGHMTRDQGIELVKKYDGKCSDVYIKDFCDYVGISITEFWNTAEKFRGTMWVKKDNNWHNTYWDNF